MHDKVSLVGTCYLAKVKSPQLLSVAWLCFVEGFEFFWLWHFRGIFVCFFVFCGFCVCVFVEFFGGSVGWKGLPKGKTYFSIV